MKRRGQSSPDAHPSAAALNGGHTTLDAQSTFAPVPSIPANRAVVPRKELREADGASRPLEPTGSLPRRRNSKRAATLRMTPKLGLPRAETGANHLLKPIGAAPRKARGNGQAPPDAHRLTADSPALVHKLLEHYGRLLLDVLKVRVACRNRQSAMERDGIDRAHMAIIDETLVDTEKQESIIERMIVRLMKKHPLAPFIESHKGIGAKSLVELFACIPPLDQFATVSKLWKFCGYSVDGGRAPRRSRGVKANYNPEARAVCYRIGSAFIKSGGGGRYREIYDQKRAEYFSRERLGPSGCWSSPEPHLDKQKRLLQCFKVDADGKETSAHAHNAALRYAIKELLKDLWIEWRNVGQTAAGAHILYADDEGRAGHRRVDAQHQRAGAALG